MRIKALIVALVLSLTFPLGIANAGGQICGADGWEDDHVGIYLFSEPNFQGRASYFCTSQKQIYNNMDNEVSSFKVMKKDANYFIALYDGKNYTGSSFSANGWVSNMGNWDNRVSSVSMGKNPLVH